MSSLWQIQVGLIVDTLEIQLRMLRAVAELRQLAAHQTDPVKAAEMRDMADRLEAQANEG
jgi:hypothetical protein